MYFKFDVELKKLLKEYITNLRQFTPDGDTSTDDFLWQDEVELCRSQS